PPDTISDRDYHASLQLVPKADGTVADALVVVFGPAPLGRRPAALGLGLGIEIIEVGVGAGSEEVVAHIADGALHAPLLVAAGHRHRARLVPVMPGEIEQGGVE